MGDRHARLTPVRSGGKRGAVGGTKLRRRAVQAGRFRCEQGASSLRSPRTSTQIHRSFVENIEGIFFFSPHKLQFWPRARVPSA